MELSTLLVECCKVARAAVKSASAEFLVPVRRRQQINHVIVRSFSQSQQKIISWSSTQSCRSAGPKKSPSACVLQPDCRDRSLRPLSSGEDCRMCPSRGRESQSSGYRAEGELECRCAFSGNTHNPVSGPHLEVYPRNGRHRTMLISIRTYRNSLRSYRFLGSLYRSQARYGSRGEVIFMERLMKKSFTRMHSCCTFSRRDGKATFEGHG